MKNYFIEELSLAEEDYQLYQKSIKMLKTSRAEIYQYLF